MRGISVSDIYLLIGVFIILSECRMNFLIKSVFGCFSDVVFVVVLFGICSWVMIGGNIVSKIGDLILFLFVFDVEFIVY